MGDRMKFEAGQVVRLGPLKPDNGAPFVVAHVYHDTVRLGVVGITENPILINRAGYEPLIELLSPAPRAGDTWTSGESVARVEPDGDGRRGSTDLRIVSEGEPFVGDVVAVARRLWEGGYRRAETRVRSAAQSSADVRECFAAFMLRDPEPPQLSREERRRSVPVHLKPKDVYAGTLSFEQVFESDPIARAMVEQVAKDASKRIAEQQPDRVAFLPGITPIERTPDGGHRVTPARRMNGRAAAAALSQAVDSLSDYQLRRAGDTWSSGVTAVELRECPQGLGMHVVKSDVRWPMLFIGDARSMAEFLIEHGYKRVEAERASDEDRRKLAAMNSAGAPVSVDDVRRRVGFDPVPPELHAGMVLRDDSRGACGEFGSIVDVGPRVADVRWGSGRATGAYRIDDIQRRIASGRWRIVDPDVRPLAALADAVAAIFAQPDRATSRRHVDRACAQLRGEPFAAAIRAVLVAASESHPSMSPHDIVSIIQCCRAHERCREVVAPGRRALADEQLDRCVDAVWNANPTGWCTSYARVYERARAAR